MSVTGTTATTLFIATAASSVLFIEWYQLLNTDNPCAAHTDNTLMVWSDEISLDQPLRSGSTFLYFKSIYRYIQTLRKFYQFNNFYGPLYYIMNIPLPTTTCYLITTA